MAFLGIPYAKVQRFMPPLPVDPWDTVRVCNHWGPQAMQMVRGRQLSEAEMSEKNSCVLNVWTTERNARKPVMVWLHGGGFDSGTSAWNPGMALARKDVVVVSVNHRLNILGFLDLSACSEQYRQSGNVGMLDIVAALKWVRDNISLFGGWGRKSRLPPLHACSKGTVPQGDHHERHHTQREYQTDEPTTGRGRAQPTGHRPRAYRAHQRRTL